MLAEQHYRRFGRTGLYVSPLGLGTDNFANPTPEDESSRIIHCAIDHGINLIDTSNSYAGGQSEEIIGRCLKSSGRRDDVILATKVHYPVGNRGINDRGNSRRHLIRACEDSLRRLQTDYIDLYQTHRVCMQTPLEETLARSPICSDRGRFVMPVPQRLRHGKLLSLSCWPNSSN